MFPRERVAGGVPTREPYDAAVFPLLWIEQRSQGGSGKAATASAEAKTAPKTAAALPSAETSASARLPACRAHTDFGFFTLLLTDDQPGLQIFLEDAWVDVPPMPDCLILNAGDMCERWTNGRFKSVLHRVVNCGRERFSTPFFWSEWV